MGVGFQAVTVKGVAGLRVLLVSVSVEVRAALRAAGARPTEIQPQQAAAQPLPAASTPDVFLVDAGLTELIHRSSVTMPVVAIASTPADGLRALEAGAAGAVSDRDGVEDVLRGLRAVARGGVYINSHFVASVVDELRVLRAARAAELQSNPLSSRETDIAVRVARGQNNSEIAQSLHLSPKTVKNHVSNCLAKLGLANRTQLAVYAVSAGLCESPWTADGQSGNGVWSGNGSPHDRPTQPIG